MTGATGHIATIPHNSTITRRAAIGGLAVLAAPSTALATASLPASDEIGEVLRRHLNAWAAWIRVLDEQEALELRIPASERNGYEGGPLDDRDHPDWKAYVERFRSTYDAMEKAADDMTDVRPRTLGQVMALLNYIDHFNEEMFVGNGSWSSIDMWPNDEYGDNNFVGLQTGRVIKMPWAFCIMRNIRAALMDIQVSEA
jgi:hypothetical protein